jgi:predicted DNA-binding transcriptional regulator AlpA
MSIALTTESEEPLVKGPTVARYLDLDPHTIRRYTREGMPHYVLGPGFIRYKLSEVLAWRAQRKTLRSLEVKE